MREALFIKKNEARWQEYQNHPVEDADVQAERFTTLLDDLAYSRTFYPHSKVTRWINNIAARIYQKIYQNKKERYTRLRTFWTDELPLVLYRHRMILLFTFIFFAVCMAMGIISSSKDPSFVKSILGEEYVTMTEANIEKGDPFGVYRDEDRFTMFVRIATNNIQVAFRAFVFGILFGIGTLWILFYNGIMVGAFEYMFFAKGLGWQSVMVIWIHGTLEIASIIIGGSSGIVMGAGYLFPGTLPRKISFKNGVKDALKIILSLVPFFIVAALLESYVTYQMSNRFSGGQYGSGLPLWAGIIILTVSLFILVWFFVWNPRRVYLRKGVPVPDDSVLVSKREAA